MRWFSLGARIVLALAGLVIGIGMLLPGTRQIERSQVIQATPAEIWAMLVEPPRWSRWSPWYSADPEARIRYSGPASGTGAEWQWDSARTGHGKMRLTRVTERRELGYEIQLDRRVDAGSGMLRLEPLAIGVRVVWQMDVELGMNPVERWRGLRIDSRLGPELEAGLRALARAVQPRY